MQTPRISVARSTHFMRVLLPVAAIALTGCPTKSVIRNLPGVVNGQPQAVGNPVVIMLDWSVVPQRSGQPSVSLDGVSQNAAFGIGGGCCTAQASFILPPGQHQVSVSVPRNQTLGTYQEYLPFIVNTGFTLTPTPASVTLVPGGAAQTVNVVATPTGGFNGSIVPGTVTGPPGVAATAVSTGPMAFSVAFTAAAGATSGLATVTANPVAGSCSNCAGTVTGSVSLPVTITGPGITITNTVPGTILVPRDGSQSLGFTVQRTGGLMGAITISASGIGNGVTAPSTTIAAGSNTGSITFNADAGAGLGNVAGGMKPPPQNATVTLTAACAATTCAGATVSRPVTVQIGRRTGAFTAASLSLQAAGSATSPDNAVSLQYALANPQPPGQTQFTATFRRAATTLQIAAINLVQTPPSWGAGFCPATPTIAGVVLSGTYGGITNAQLFYSLPIWAPAPATTPARQITLPVYTQSGTVTQSVTPTLWYSPDCTIAAFPSASGVAATPITLNIVDMTTGSPIGAGMPFAGAFPSSIEVLGTTSPQTIRVTFSPTDVRPPVTIP